MKILSAIFCFSLFSLLAHTTASEPKSGSPKDSEKRETVDSEKPTVIKSEYVDGNKTFSSYYDQDGVFRCQSWGWARYLDYYSDGTTRYRRETFGDHHFAKND